MEYMSCPEAAEKWGISERRVQILCKENRIPGVSKIGYMWLIPKSAVKPFDKRIKRSVDIDGFRICQKIRENYYFPVIMLTAKIDDGDKIMGLTIGADDYITKPFNPLEVIARVKTQLRRYQKYNNPTKKQFFPKSEYDIRGLIINKDTHKCFLFGKEISLTPIEFSILWYLCEHQGKVVSTEELFENIWKEKYLDNYLSVYGFVRYGTYLGTG